MDAFFEKRDLLFLQMIGLIIEIDEPTISLVELAKALKVDKRALISCLYQYGYLALEKHGLYLKVETNDLVWQLTSHFSLNAIRQLLFRETLLFKLCDKLAFQQINSLISFADSHFVSLSSLYRRMNKLKTVLEEYELTLDLSNSCYFLGEEKQIRHFLFELFFQAYGLTDGYLEKGSSLEKVMTKVSVTSSQEYRFSFLQQMKLLSYITIMRGRQGYYLPKNQMEWVRLPSFFSHKRVKKQLNVILTSFISSINVLETEANFLLVYLVTHDIIPYNQLAMLPFSQLLTENEYGPKTQKWINEFTHFFNVELGIDGYLYLYVNLSQHFLRNRLLKGASRFNLDDEHVQLIQNGNEYVYQQTMAFCDYLNQSEEEVLECQGNNVQLFYFFLIKEVLQYSKPVAVSVYSSINSSYKESVEREIQRLSPIPLVFTDDIVVNPDLIVSDHHVSQHVSANQEVSIVITDTFPTEKNYSAVIKGILRIHDATIGKEPAE